MKIDKTGILSGGMFTGFGIAALALGRDLPLGSAARMGPGYFPRALGIALILLGIVIAWRALHAARIEIASFAWRPLVAVTAGLILFSQLLASIGLVLSLIVLTVVSRIARPEYAWQETALLSIVLAAACVCIFYFGLGLQLPLWPALG